MRLVQVVGVVLILQVHLSALSGATFLLAKPGLLARASKTTTAAPSEGASEQDEPALALDQLAEETEKLNKWSDKKNEHEADPEDHEQQHQQQQIADPLRWAHDKRLFVVELLRMLHEKYGGRAELTKDKSDNESESGDEISNKEDRHQLPSSRRRSAMKQLLEAISADGDIRRLTDWLQNSFNLASVSELTTQFVVSKLGSVNCAALFPPDNKESLVPRFLLFNEHFADVPYELSMEPSTDECLAQGRFDPFRKTVVLVHGYLTGYTLVDGMTNIKNRLLDINKLANERAMSAFLEAQRSNGSYVLTGDLETKLRRQKYNVIIVDWFSGANPVPRANYIQAAANARAVGEFIAQFLVNLIARCRTPSSNLQIIAHSLGCHVAGFTGKAMVAARQPLGKITHLDPIGLCFGRLFSSPQFRLSPNDAQDTQAVHVSLNLFDNPLDGARSNFLVNGGRDQSGCQGTSELKNSTSSSLNLLVDPGARFAPCSHLRALSLFEDDLSSSSKQCQIVGYRCATYGRFLAGKCGKCDALNSQCRLMSFPPLTQQFTRMNLFAPNGHQTMVQWDSHHSIRPTSQVPASNSSGQQEPSGILGLVRNHLNGSIAWVVDDQELNVRIGNVIAKMKPHLVTSPPTVAASSSDSVEIPTSPAAVSTQAKSKTETTAEQLRLYSSNEVASRRSDRRLMGDHRELIAQTLDRIRSETSKALTGWTSIRPNLEAKYKVSSLLNLAGPQMNLFSGLTVPRPSIELDHINIPLPSLSAADLANPLGALEQDLITAPAPIGSQPLPAGSSIGPLYYVGTGAISPYCVNYYQFRILISESRIKKHLQSNKGSPSRMAHISSHKRKSPSSAAREEPAEERDQQQEQQQQQVLQKQPPRQATLSRDMLHLTVKLSDSNGHFFKGFTMVEDTRNLPRASAAVLMGTRGPSSSESMVELTMLLNTTSAEPVRVGETIISYYFHGIVLADTVEVNYMSNISPDVRARFSSVLCPVAINDQHQLVRYIECNKVK